MTTPILSATLVRAQHVRTFDIRATAPGSWQAVEEEDQQVIRKQHYADWHRVERAFLYYTRTIANLVEAGWSRTT